jgi:hypothetical protein
MSLNIIEWLIHNNAPSQNTERERERESEREGQRKLYVYVCGRKTEKKTLQGVFT